MNEKLYETKKLRLAEVRMFNSERKASLIPEVRAYTIMENIDGSYKDLYNPYSRNSIYDRVPYSNTTLDGEDYGTMITLVSGVVKDGECYILDLSLDKVLPRDIIYRDELDEFILESNKFFPERIKIIEKMPFYDRIKYRKKYVEDKLCLEEFNAYLNSCDKSKQYRR